MQAPIILLENVQFRWPDTNSNCLDIARLEIMPGEQVFMHGPSGSGKSTLLGILGGVHIAQSGKVRILGISLETLSNAQRDRFRADHIGFLFQQFNLIPYLSVLDNVLLPCRFSRRRAQAASLTEAKRLLSALELHNSLWHRPVTALSVGQQQRTAAARALIGKPELIIADEPTSALDADRQKIFLDLLIQQCTQSNATLVFVSHDKRLSPAFSREIALPAINHVQQDTPL